MFLVCYFTNIYVCSFFLYVLPGCSWTRKWLQFDNSYFLRASEDSSDASQLLWLPTDQALYDSPEFRPYFVRYMNSQEDFFADYAAAHKKMSELGAKFQFRVSLC